MLVPYLTISSLSFIRRNGRRNNLQPALRTLLNIRIVALGIRTVIPVTLFLFLWGRLYIHRLLLLVDDRWCRIVWIGIVWIGIVWIGIVWIGIVWIGIVWIGIVWIGIVWITPGTPSRSNPDTSTIIVSRSVIVSRPVIVS
jgi:hypothetical protein